MRTLICMIALLMALPAFADKDRGGGNVIVCTKGLAPVFPFGYSQVYLADTFEFFRSGRGAILPKNISPEQMIHVIAAQLNSRQAGLGDLILERAKALKIEFVKKVEQLDDVFGPTPPRCSRKQLAVQNIATLTVRTVRKYYDQLSYWEKAFFYVHEAFISLRNPGPDTRPVREAVRAVLAAPDFNTFITQSFVQLQNRLETKEKHLQVLEGLLFEVCKQMHNSSNLRPEVCQPDGIWNFRFEQDNALEVFLNAKLKKSLRSVSFAPGFTYHGDSIFKEWVLKDIYSAGIYGNWSDIYLAIKSAKTFKEVAANLAEVTALPLK